MLRTFAHPTTAKIFPFASGGRGKPRSLEQLRQRELAWALYITEGYVANLTHALAVNAVTFGSRDKAQFKSLIALVETQAQHIRTAMNRRS